MGVEYAAVPQSEQHAQGPAAAATAALEHEIADDEAAAGYHHHGSATTRRRISWYEFAKRALVLGSMLMLGLVLGFCVGRRSPDLQLGGGGTGEEAQAGAEGSVAASVAVDVDEQVQGLLPPSAFVPESECCTASILVMGRSFCVKRKRGKERKKEREREGEKACRLICETFAVPLKGVQFTFPTPYEDPGVPGDKLWNALMPSK